MKEEERKIVKFEVTPEELDKALGEELQVFVNPIKQAIIRILNSTLKPVYEDEEGT
ncbi:MAG: hypothetical protein KAH32_08620 [Chlamydiia bacterium]|nr:hypothetical protein [Chlamydiia bacterium]